MRKLKERAGRCAAIAVATVMLSGIAWIASYPSTSVAADASGGRQ